MRDEPFDGPPGESEQAQLLARRRIDGEPIRILGVALRGANLGRVAIEPDGAFAQQPMRGEPSADEYDRRPPRERKENDGGRDAAYHLRHAAGDEVHGDRQRRPGHPEIEVTGRDEVARERGVLEVRDARRDGRTSP